MPIKLLSTIQHEEESLESLLIDCVKSGASVGFIAPLQQYDAKQYWQQVETDLLAGSRKLLVFYVEKQIAGALQLSFCQKANGLHRADVEKLMVHSDFRQQGIGRQLLEFAEKFALENHRSLLVLDTRTNDVASYLYCQQGYIEVGKIPKFVTNEKNEFESTTIFYKLLCDQIE